MVSVLLTVAAALALDRLLGEPRRYHPLVGWSHWVVMVERWCNRDCRWSGVLAWLLVITPPCAGLVGLLALSQWFDNRYQPALGLSSCLSVLCLYLAVGWQSLRQHGGLVAEALSADIESARAAVSRIVSRDCAQLDRAAVVRATLESLLENGADAIFAPLFWFIVAGPEAALVYRLANTLDAMWGYRTARFANFGWFSARVDDGLNFLPARLTAYSYALLGQTRDALQCWRQQASACISPNAGPVMCAGAGGLAVLLGGRAMYHGQWRDKPVMGCGVEPVAGDIARALTLIDRSVYLWLAVLLMMTSLWQLAGLILLTGSS
jgi:adenosylcobinamide-phosphate synthase